MVRLFRGTIPAGQAETSHGRAELVVYDVGDFTVIVQSAGYATAQKELSINAAGSAEVDIYLRPSSATPTAVPGRPLLAPKARKVVDQGVRALAADNLAEAQKQASQAMLLAPGHPDVLYLQGVVFLKQRDWAKAQDILEKATQIDPSDASAFTALGMALRDRANTKPPLLPWKNLYNSTLRRLPGTRAGLWPKPTISWPDTIRHCKCPKRRFRLRTERRPKFSCSSRNR